MGTEASKTKAIWGPEILNLLHGDGIDIGCGADPILPTVDCFDQPQGDANLITQYVHKRYDFVFASHSLEHMREPYAALKEWFALLKPGGHLIALVPDEDLYEQGFFPSAFNPDHKATFTVSKARSWSPCSINVLDLARSVDAEVVSVTLQDQGLDRRLLNPGASRWGRRLGRWASKLGRRFPAQEVAIARSLRRWGALVDQTGFADGRLAQIQFVLKKRI